MKSAMAMPPVMIAVINVITRYAVCIRIRSFPFVQSVVVQLFPHRRAAWLLRALRRTISRVMVLVSLGRGVRSMRSSS
jgi:hypothetical protein